jgi:hypothetical protein
MVDRTPYKLKMPMLQIPTRAERLQQMQNSWKVFQEAEALKRQEERSKKQEEKDKDKGKQNSKWYLFQETKEKATKDKSASSVNDQTSINTSTMSST